MEQLRAVFGQVQIQPLLLKVVAEALIFFAAEQIFHPPIPLGQSLDCEGDETLGAMRRQVYDGQIKAVRLRLPLCDNEILRGGILRPGRARLEDFDLPSSHCG